MDTFTIPETGDSRGGASFMTMDAATFAQAYIDANRNWVSIGLWQVLPGESWLAPNILTAQRWADEINGRGGCAEIETHITENSLNGRNVFIAVKVFHNPYGTSSKLTNNGR